MATTLKLLRTKAAVIDALDGNTAVGLLTDSKPPAVSNWRNSAAPFPANTYCVMTDELAKRGYRALRSLWGMREPPRGANRQPERASA